MLEPDRRLLVRLVDGRRHYLVQRTQTSRIQAQNDELALALGVLLEHDAGDLLGLEYDEEEDKYA